jgi:hypothetical protein
MTDHDAITRLWSDDELDEVLRGLHAETPDGTTALATARAKLLAAATGNPVRVTWDGAAPSAASGLSAGRAPVGAPVRGRRRWLRIGLTAGIAAVLVIVGLLVPSFVTEHDKPVNSAQAIGALNRAAVAALGATDEPVGAGQYRYIETHAWWTTFSGYDIFQDESLIRIWVPAAPDDPAQDWMLDRHPTGNRVWIKGSEEQAREDGTFIGALDTGVTLQTEAPCGNFYSPGPCPRAGSWQDPTPSFLAELPRDPALLYDRLQADAPDNGRGPAELLVYAADALRTGLVPADLRAALYQALTRLDGIDLTDRAANLDGRVGTAIGIDDGQFRQDIIIDAATGTFIGEREVLTDDVDGAPEGTTMSYTAVDTAVVDGIGTIPGK